mgnify:CR=1 FL=1
MSSKRTSSIATAVDKGIAGQVERRTRKQTSVDIGAIKADRLQTVIKGVVVPQPPPMTIARRSGGKAPKGGGTPKS